MGNYGLAFITFNVLLKACIKKWVLAAFNVFAHYRNFHETQMNKNAFKNFKFRISSKLNRDMFTTLLNCGRK